MPGIHGEEGDLGQVGAHGEGVVGGDAGRPQLLQQQRLEIDQMARAEPEMYMIGSPAPTQLAFAVEQVDLDLGAALAWRSPSSQSSASRGAETTGRRMKMA